MHSHDHGGGTGRILWWSLVATAVFVIVELIAGIQAHSLALLSDAGHNFTDALALLLAWFGFYLQAKPANEVKTFGYHRAGVLTAFINALTLVVLAGWIFYESYQRLLRRPCKTADDRRGGRVWCSTGGMWGPASRGITISIFAARLCTCWNLLGSIGIVIGAVIIRYTGWQQIDLCFPF